MVYGCVFDELYEAKSANATTTTDELLMYSWGWSIMQAHAHRAHTHRVHTHARTRAHTHARAACIAHVHGSWVVAEGC